MPTRKSRRGAPTVNAGSMADIAFLLLIFFLVTTTILEEEGVLVRLPVWDEEPPKPTALNQDKVLTVGINKADELLVEGEVVTLDEVPILVEDHLTRPDFPATEAIVSLTHDRSSSYDVYLAVYDALLAGYRRVRDDKAGSQYGKTYAELTDYDKKQIRKEVPLILSEAEPTDFQK